MIHNLVISGGGIKIISTIGIIKLLEEEKIIKNINKFYGTSAGSLICLLIILGFSSSEMIKFIEKFDFNKIFYVCTDKIFDEFCVCDNSKFEKLIKLFINFKLKNSHDITMIELFNLTNKFLTITTISIKQKKVVYLDHLTYPDLPVYKAIVMSCSIPLIFAPVKWQDDLFIDGGLIDNFPLFNIPNNEILSTLGIQICLDISKLDTHYDNIYNYTLTLIKIIMEYSIQIKSYNIISVLIDSDIVSNSLDINISSSIRLELINQGYIQAKEKFNKLFKNSLTNTSLIKKRANSI